VLELHIIHDTYMHYTVYSVLVILNDAFNADVINENEREGRLEEIQKALWMIWLIITLAEMMRTKGNPEFTATSASTAVLHELKEPCIKTLMSCAFSNVRTEKL
jgi:hypothetical protein